VLYQIKFAIAKLLVSFRFGARSKPGKVKPRRQRGATIVTGGGGGRVAAQEYNRDSLKSSVFSREWKVAEERASGGYRLS